MEGAAVLSIVVLEATVAEAACKFIFKPKQ